MIPSPDPTDERRHPPGSEQLWNESYYFDFATDDASLGGYVRIGLYPNLDAVWYWACVVGEGRDLVTVIDHEVPLPTREQSLEVRSSGLWADHTCETPLDHFGLGLEAFGVALEDPTEVYRAGRGDRVPLGFDLEWDTDGNPYRYPPGLDRYEIPCSVHGEVLVGDERIDLVANGQRDHSWGHRDWWALGWCWVAGRLEDGTRFHGVRVLSPGLDWSTGYLQGGGSDRVVERFEVEHARGRDGLPEDIGLDLEGLIIAAVPVAWSPVLLVAPDGRESRFPRALCRFAAADGRFGTGWIEFNQPPPA